MRSFMNDIPYLPPPPPPPLWELHSCRLRPLQTRSYSGAPGHCLDEQIRPVAILDHGLNPIAVAPRFGWGVSVENPGANGGSISILWRRASGTQTGEWRTSTNMAFLRGRGSRLRAEKFQHSFIPQPGRPGEFLVPLEYIEASQQGPVQCVSPYLARYQLPPLLLGQIFFLR